MQKECNLFVAIVGFKNAFGSLGWSIRENGYHFLAPCTNILQKNINKACMTLVINTLFRNLSNVLRLHAPSRAINR